MDYNKMIYGFYINQLWIILMYIYEFWIMFESILDHTYICNKSYHLINSFMDHP